MKLLIGIIASGLVLAATVTLTAGEPISDIPPAVRSNLQDAVGVIHHAAQLAKTGHVGPKERKEYWQQADRFDEALDRLGESLKEADVASVAGEETIEAKLLVLAWDRKHRHELYDEIETKYVSIEAFLARGGYAERSLGIHGVDTRHQTEAYRLIWEYLLIRPTQQEVILLVTSPWRDSEAPERWRRWEQAIESHVARSPDLSERQQRFLGDLRKALARQILQP